MTRKMVFKLFLSLLCFTVVLAKPKTIDLVAEETKQFEQGEGKAFEATHHSAEGEEGKKGYSAHHVNEKGETGHHDKERHQKEYAEEGGNKKSHHHDDGYYASGHKGSHGEKGYHFVDKGSYAKGHDTKGHHNVHKLNEFEKKKEFFDEDYDESHKEKHGGFEQGNSFEKEDFQKGGHAKKVFYEGAYGAKGLAEKGDYNKEEGGRKKAAGNDQYFKEAEQFAKKEGADIFKELGYSEKDKI
ncbi:uncharacterized protein LOC126738718 [Anthonomus grandis grandis]|uniref:uncharacterized protein LOC126738718 n=1 Tax=Anthonomus grandis grandis TaxID=2921223 RepID=UPI0021653ECA|nr:uncharacterized protein LOC126738718 [Anthonomus grandis grandis]